MPGEDGESADGGTESLSQFAARVLDQLSITAWFPAAALVMISVVLAQLVRNDGSLPQAFADIGRMSFSALALLFGAVIISTVVTQAFEFEAIRLLEGYWPTTGPFGALRRRRCAAHMARCEDLRKTCLTLAADAVSSSRSNLRAAGHGTGVYDALVSVVTNTPMVAGVSEQDRQTASTLVRKWKSLADAALVQELEAARMLRDEYPTRTYRVLSTRLGNTIRAVEDRVHDPQEGRLENFAIRVLDTLPRAIVRAFREERRRLDLYCSLFIIFAMATPASIASGVTYEGNVATRILVPAILLTLAIVSYRAALASGRRFGFALTAIDEHQKRIKRAAPAAPPAVPGPQP